MKKFTLFVLVFIVFSICLTIFVPSVQANASSGLQYTFGESEFGAISKKYDLDTGFGKNGRAITKGDKHFGWSIGYWRLKNFAARNGTAFARTTEAGDIELEFVLTQDINRLNGDSGLKISNDGNGYVTTPQVTQRDMGRGFVVIEETLSNGEKKQAEHRNFFSKSTSGAENIVKLNAEASEIRVTLCYELHWQTKEGWWIFKKTVNNYENYKMQFSFSIQNGNCIFFLFDVSTGKELSDRSTTENGFKLDLANSKHLQLIIKKEIKKQTNDGLVEDARFNKVVFDGITYTEEGKYTITAINTFYPNFTLTKVIYVGRDPAMIENVVNGTSIADYYKNLSNNNGSGNIDDGAGDDNQDQESLPWWGAILIVLASGILIGLVILIFRGSGKKGDW